MLLRSSIRGVVALGALVCACVNEPTSLGEQESEGEGSGTAAGTTEDDPSASGPMDGTGAVDGTGAATTDVSTTSAEAESTSGETESDTDTASTGEPDDPPMAAAIVFVNFDGVTLSAGVDDATMDQSALAGSFDGMPLAPYGEGPKRAQIMAALADDWAPFDVAVTDVRPASGDYAMIVVTPTNPIGMGVLGVASQDCGDINPGSVGMVFASADDALSATLTATVISHEAGRGLGLENVVAMGAIMNTTASENGSFMDACHDLQGDPACDHTAFCPAGQQNSHAELSALFPL
ncbi:MAG: hypothetical protein AAF799_06875 [Myxococcota bacterium]